MTLRLIRAIRISQAVAQESWSCHPIFYMMTMSKTWKTVLLLLSLPAVSVMAAEERASEETIVSTHGRLRVHDAHVVDRDNRKLSLMGNSMYSSNTGWEAVRLYNSEVVSWLQKDFKATVIRAALAVEEAGGYTVDPEGNVARVKTVIEAGIANGMYVIIDFHSFEAHEFTDEAVAFFSEMAGLYGENDHVIYEIYNEPLKVSWSEVVKPYAEKVIAAIRAIDPDNLIIVGTPHWSQKVVEAADDPIVDGNVAYTLHFYADSHGQWLRDEATQAMEKGIALFITEWGTCDSSGDGGFNPEAADEWLDFAYENGLSLCNWAVNDKDQTVSIIKPGADSNGGWTEGDYTESGTYVRNRMRNWPGQVRNVD